MTCCVLQKKTYGFMVEKAKHTDDKASVYIVDALSKIGENFLFKDI